MITLSNLSFKIKPTTTLPISTSNLLENTFVMTNYYNPGYPNPYNPTPLQFGNFNNLNVDVAPINWLKIPRRLSFLNLGASGNTWKVHDYNTLLARYPVGSFFYIVYKGRLFRLRFNGAESPRIRNTSIWHMNLNTWVETTDTNMLNTSPDGQTINGRFIGWNEPYISIVEVFVSCILQIDPMTYSGTGNQLYSQGPFNSSLACTLGGTFTYQGAVGGGSMRLSNTSGDLNANVSHLQLPTLSNVRTVSIWYFIHSALAIRYLIDAREGASNSWFYNGGGGGVWTQMFINGGAIQNISNTLVDQTGVWRHVTLISNVAVTDDITLFARFSKNEGLDVSFGVIMIYNRVISESENASLFNLSRSRYGV
jgi:hypothetical protein